MIPKRSELPELFGEIKDGKWEKESDHMCFIAMPPVIASKVHYNRIYCNKIIADPLRKALQNIINRGLTDELKEWNGCFIIRKSRTSDRLSVHSWGLAVDINASTNRLGTIGDMSSELVKCFTDADFSWGGHWQYPDPMHFEYVEEA